MIKEFRTIKLNYLSIDLLDQMNLHNHFQFVTQGLQLSKITSFIQLLGLINKDLTKFKEDTKSSICSDKYLLKDIQDSTYLQFRQRKRLETQQKDSLSKDASF